MTAIQDDIANNLWQDHLEYTWTWRVKTQFKIDNYVILFLNQLCQTSSVLAADITIHFFVPFKLVTLDAEAHIFVLWWLLHHTGGHAVVVVVVAGDVPQLTRQWERERAERTSLSRLLATCCCVDIVSRERERERGARIDVASCELGEDEGVGGGGESARTREWEQERVHVAAVVASREVAEDKGGGGGGESARHRCHCLLQRSMRW
ncbi:hypothetical protein OG21DRAFT_1525921 [Imleria badia]|nr:hypothetical protein OG21DRAFT_1525921 [Imleria badia]